MLATKYTNTPDCGLQRHPYAHTPGNSSVDFRDLPLCFLEGCYVFLRVHGQYKEPYLCSALWYLNKLWEHFEFYISAYEICSGCLSSYYFKLLPIFKKVFRP